MMITDGRWRIKITQTGWRPEWVEMEEGEKKRGKMYWEKNPNRYQFNNNNNNNILTSNWEIKH